VTFLTHEGLQALGRSPSSERKLIDARGPATAPRVDGLAEILPDSQSCEELLCAVIALAIRDLKQIEHLEDKPTLTAYERHQLLALTQEWSPAAFLEGDWFEEICRMLNVEPETIRTAVRERRDGDEGRLPRHEHPVNARTPGDERADGAGPAASATRR